jgi:hypothetical protein
VQFLLSSARSPPQECKEDAASETIMVLFHQISSCSSADCTRFTSFEYQIEIANKGFEATREDTDDIEDKKKQQLVIKISAFTCQDFSFTSNNLANTKRKKLCTTRQERDHGNQRQNHHHA